MALSPSVNFSVAPAPELELASTDIDAIRAWFDVRPPPRPIPRRDVATPAQKRGFSEIEPYDEATLPRKRDFGLTSPSDSQAPRHPHHQIDAFPRAVNIRRTVARQSWDFAKITFPYTSLPSLMALSIASGLEIKSQLAAAEADVEMIDVDALQVARKEPFNLFESIMSINDIALEFCSHLDAKSFLNLYCISKRMHYYVDSNLVTYLKRNAQEMCPDSLEEFKWKWFPELCIADPVARRKESKPDNSNNVPSLQWLQMAHFRESVVEEIIARLAIEGHRLPQQASRILKKVWTLMEQSSNSARIGIIQSRRHWANGDLLCALTFFMKLDLRFTDPVKGNGEVGLRHLMLSQQSLVPLVQLLREGNKAHELPIMALDALTRFRRLSQRPGDTANVFGVTGNNFSNLAMEGWGEFRDGRALQRPDELILIELVRRQMTLSNYFHDALIWGWITNETSQNQNVVTEEDMWRELGNPRPRKRLDEVLLDLL